MDLPKTQKTNMAIHANPATEAMSKKQTTINQRMKAMLSIRVINTTQINAPHVIAMLPRVM